MASQNFDHIDPSLTFMKANEFGTIEKEIWGYK